MSVLLSATEQGRELIAGLRHIDTCLVEWLVKLDDFDTWGAWAEDGHASCVSWLVERYGLGRATAHDKLRVAKQLGRRKILAEAMARGEVSYSKVRSITRIDDGDDDLDRSLLVAAEHGTVADLERVVRHWRLNHDQEKPPSDNNQHRGLYRQPGFGGAPDRIIIELPADDAERVMNILDAYLDWQHRHPQPVDRGSLNTADGGEPVDRDSVNTANADPAPRPGIRARRLDALLDLFEHTGYEHHDKMDVERAAIGVTVDYDTLINNTPGGADLASGATITGEAARRLACDAGIHRLIVKGPSEILDAGRKTRTWNRAQRRAIAARHRNRCAIAGCDRRIFQIHHIDWWENGGHTDINLGLPLCLSHHHLLHGGGWTVTYNPATGVTLTGPAGQTITSTGRMPKTAAG